MDRAVFRVLPEGAGRNTTGHCCSEAVQADLGAVMFWPGLDHDDQVLADSNHRGYEMFEIQGVTVLGNHND
jgi:hypothetical protein